MIRKNFLNKAAKNGTNVFSGSAVICLYFTVCHIHLNCFSLNINFINNKEYFEVQVNQVPLLHFGGEVVMRYFSSALV